PATAAPEQEVTVETDLVKVVLSNRGGVIKRWELKRYLDTDPTHPKPIELVPAGEQGVSFTRPLALEVPDSKLQGRLTDALYAVSGDKDLRLSAAQPTGEIGYTYTVPVTVARFVKRLVIP